MSDFEATLDDIHISSKAKKPMAGIDVTSLLEREEEERSEVMSIRITPTARKQIEQIWLSQRKKRKKLKESTVAAEILINVLARQN